MPQLNCYKLKSEPVDGGTDNFDRWIDLKATDVTYGPITRRGFRANLYVRSGAPMVPAWTKFVGAPFDNPDWVPGRYTSAALVVETEDGDCFAFAFGPGGRFMIRPDGYDRAFGLRTALNLLSEGDGGPVAEAPELRAVNLSRMGTNTRRSQQQLSKSSSISEFELDTLQDIFVAATGRPQEVSKWGTTVTGRESLHISLDLSFDELGDLCKDLSAASVREDYQAHFRWVDYFQPVSDQTTQQELVDSVLRAFKDQDWESLDLAPPDLLDWSQVAGFHYHFDRKPRGGSVVLHPELRIQDYFRGVQREIDRVDWAYLKTHDITIRDGDHRKLHGWPVWRWLNGTFTLEEGTFVLDSGNFFSVDQAYLESLNAEIDEIPITSLLFPHALSGEQEGTYTERIAADLAPCLVLDGDLVRRGAGESPVELCDLMTADRRLIHIKRHFASRGISHLLAQATGSAEMLQMDREFRERAATLISKHDSEALFEGWFSDAPFETRAFEVVLAIIGRWNGRSASKALPFLSKVNLRNAVRRFQSSNYGYSLAPIGVGELGG